MNTMLSCHQQMLKAISQQHRWNTRRIENETQFPLHCYVSNPKDDFCWQFEEADKTKFYQFTYAQSMMKYTGAGEQHSMLNTMICPINNKELVITSSTMEYYRSVEKSYVRVLKSSGVNLGLLSFSKMKSKECFDGIVKEQYQLKHEFLYLDEHGHPIDPQTRGVERINFDWLRNQIFAQNLKTRISIDNFDREQMQAVERIYFPNAVAINQAGMEAKSEDTIYDYRILTDKITTQNWRNDQASRKVTTGICMELYHAKTKFDPAIQVIGRIDPDGSMKLLFIKTCWITHYDSFRKKVYEETRDSWFSSSKKFVLLVDEFEELLSTCEQHRYTIPP